MLASFVLLLNPRSFGFDSFCRLNARSSLRESLGDDVGLSIRFGEPSSNTVGRSNGPMGIPNKVSIPLVEANLFVQSSSSTVSQNSATGASECKIDMDMAHDSARVKVPTDSVKS